jgi:ribose/xylose/arabinose/galactoside ABC-type transport system permease subunit
VGESFVTDARSIDQQAGSVQRMLARGWQGFRSRVSFDSRAGVIVALVAVGIYLGVTEPLFLSWPNWQNIFRAQSIVAILAIGATLVVLTGGLDLSAASATAVAGMVCGIVVKAGAPWWVAALAAVGIGIALGLVNGVLIGIVKIPFLVVTLGTLSIYASIALLSTGGDTLIFFGSKNFKTIDTLVNGTVGPFPTILIIVSALYAIAAAGLAFTSFGRSLYAVGSNAEAARLAGINVTFVLVTAYTIAGLCAGLAGVVAVGRLSAAGPQVDPNLLLLVLGAVLIGGTSFLGGEGGVLGTALGVIFLGVVQNGLQLSNVSAFWQGTISGVILIAAVGLGVLRQHGWARFQRLRLRVSPPPAEAATIAPQQPPAAVAPRGAAEDELTRLRRENAELRARLEEQP